MGNSSSSESLVSTQSISNQINNVSNENCINACDSDISNINMIIENSDIEGDINVSAVCNILGASCILKASLSDTVQNTQKNKQLAETLQESDPFTWFSSSSANTTEDSNESIANRVSNIMNSTCQNDSDDSVSGVNIELIGDRVGGSLNVDAKGNITKSQCIIDNVSRTTLSNDQTNSQTAKVMQGSPILFAILGIVIIVVIVMIGLVILGVGGLGVLGAGGVLMGEFSKKPPQGMQRPPQGMQRPPQGMQRPPQGMQRRYR
jgi:hypothetical protein